jgi:SiaC family regulatory phosphoprotein
MQSLIIHATNNTPKINCDNALHTISISGESRPEDIKKFYSPLFDWITEYESVLYYQASMSQHNITITINFKLVYFNSSSLKVFIEIIDKINSMKTNNGKINVQINWHYDVNDDDILEAGEEFVKMTGVGMNFVSYS